MPRQRRQPSGVYRGPHAVDSAPEVLGTEMAVVLQGVSLPFSSEFRRAAMVAFMEPFRQKTREKGSYKTVRRERPPAEGVVVAHLLEDTDELEAKLGVPADQLGSLLAAVADWRPIDLPARRAAGQATRDFEDCMRAAVALNAYSTQLRVTNGTTLLYQRIKKRTGMKPGALNVISRDNDAYQNIHEWQIRAYCRECGRKGLSTRSLNPSDHRRPFWTAGRIQGDGWFMHYGSQISLKVPSADIAGKTKVGCCNEIMAASLHDLTSEARARLEAAADSSLIDHHNEHHDHIFDGARFMVDKSSILGMELRYRHSYHGEVSVDFALPLRAITELAAYTAYWPATSESARFRLLSRPLQQGENGLESIELEPPDDGGRVVAVVPSHVSPAPFHLLSAHDSLPADVSSLGCWLLPLTEGQLRTLRWARSREGRGRGRHERAVGGAGAPGDSDFVSTQVIDRRFGESDLVLQLRVERVYSNVRGGILAHAMGYGKTAIMIALIHSTRQALRCPRDATGPDDSAARKCLRRCPAAAFEGTSSGSSGPPGSEPPAEATEGETESPELAAQPLATGATLIITPLNLFYQWASEFHKFLGASNGGLRILLVEDMAKLRSIKCSDILASDVVIVAAPFFLSDDYRRHFDEIAGVGDHAPPAVRYAILREYTRQFVGPKRKRVPVGSGPVIIEMFDWERVIFDEFHKCVGEAEQYSASWRALHEIRARFRWGLTGTPNLTLPLRVSEMAAMLHIFVPPDNRVEAQRFLDLWVRADEWDMSGIRVYLHVITVQQTPTERALYIARKQWLEGKKGADAELLPFCSHFAPQELDTGNADTANAAILRVLDQQKRERAAQQGRLHEAEHALARSEADDPRVLRSRVDEARQQLAQMTSTISFLAATLGYIAKLNAGDEHECAVCMGDTPPEAVSVTRCGHVFCTDCITSYVASGNDHCPTCRAALRSQDFDAILKLSQSSAGGVDNARYGTKIARIIAELRRIHSEDETSRVLVFVQWNELLLKLEAALEHYGVHCVALRGSVAQRQRTITAFAEGEHRYVLLLAMEHDDTGLNLTCSNHLFFVHPMVAEPELARACERQALGRVRRRGQARAVHVYRFVAAGTIEVERAREHHAILFPGD